MGEGEGDCVWGDPCVGVSVCVRGAWGKGEGGFGGGRLLVFVGE